MRNITVVLIEPLIIVLDFLREEEILTVPDWLQAADYSDPNEVRGPRPSPPTIDYKST